jgi:hypothetical protein
MAATFFSNQAHRVLLGIGAREELRVGALSGHSLSPKSLRNMPVASLARTSRRPALDAKWGLKGSQNGTRYEGSSTVWGEACHPIRGAERTPFFFANLLVLNHSSPNRPQLANPNATIGDSFGQIQSTVADNRDVQFGLKFVF